MALSAADLAGMRATVDSLLPDTATNSRTSAHLPCYLAPETRLYSIERGLRFRSNVVTLDYATDVTPGDVLTIGTVSYAVQSTSTPRSNSTEVYATVIPATLTLAALMAPEQAIFQHRTDLTKTVPASVYVTSHLEDVQLYGQTPAYPWTVVYENTVAYPGGGKIGADHRVLLASVFGADGNSNPRAGVISKPRPILHGLPFMVCYAKEMAG